MKVVRYQCDRPGCNAFSNGSITAWWGVRHINMTVEVRPLREVRDLPSSESWDHLCGIQHAIETVQDAMRAMRQDGQ